MKVHLVELDLPLPDDKLIDIFLVQWRTPQKGEEGDDSSTIERCRTQKRDFLNRFADWLSEPVRANPTRPLFIVTPEISTPECCVKILDRIAEGSPRPTVIVAGLEYMEWPHFSEMLRGSANPQKDCWLRAQTSPRKVNAATIWTRQANGTLAKYLQPKLHPNDPEQTDGVHAGDNVILFHHKDTRPGYGLSFCVQICSDFCNPQSVLELRKGINTAFAQALRLDLTFLIQCNEDQCRPEFRDGANAYFAVPDRIVDTRDGSLVFVNNASRTPGKSRIWGNSQFRFVYGRWRSLGGEETFWLKQKSGEKWQAAVFRESGPSTYWVTYKPPHLVDPGPGQGQAIPFEKAQHCSILEVADPDAEGACICFSPIPARLHWLESQWRERQSQLDNRVHESQENEREEKPLWEDFSGAYASGLRDWLEALNEDKAWDAIKTYFCCFLGQEGYPSDSDGRGASKGREPLAWCAGAEQAAKEWMVTHSLLWKASFSQSQQLRAAPTKWRHAQLEDETDVVYLWGGNRQSAKALAKTYVSMLPNPHRVYGQSLLVLLTPQTRPPTADILVDIRERVTEAPPPPNAGSHLQNQGGEVVDGERRKHAFLYDHQLAEALEKADVASFRRHLSEILQEALRDAR